MKVLFERAYLLFSYGECFPNPWLVELFCEEVINCSFKWPFGNKLASNAVQHEITFPHSFVTQYITIMFWLLIFYVQKTVTFLNISVLSSFVKVWLRWLRALESPAASLEVRERGRLQWKSIPEWERIRKPEGRPLWGMVLKGQPAFIINACVCI